MLTAIILAAGRGERMGRAKPFLPLGGKTALEILLDAIAGCDPGEVIVIGNPDHESLYNNLARSDFELVMNPAPELGMFESARLGLRFVDPHSTHALFTLADMPGIRAATFRRVAEAAPQHPDHLLIAHHLGRPRHPIIVPRSLFQALLDWTGSEGLRGFCRAHENRIVAVPVNDPFVCADLDTPADYEEFTADWEKSQRGE